MNKTYINPDTLFPSKQYGFSQGVAAGHGTTIYLSGQVAWDQDQQIIGPDNLGAQTRQALRNVETALAEVGATLGDVVSMRIYIVATAMKESNLIGEALRTFFPEEARPATTWIGVESLARQEFLVEIEAIAVVTG